MSKHTDTDRLNWLLQFIEIDDIGDDDAVPGICVQHENLEEKLTYGKYDESIRGYRSLVLSWNDDRRDVIDRAIDVHGAGDDR